VKKEIKSVQTTSQATIGASVAVGGIASILSSSSSNGAFSSVNQFQLYLLLPLVGAYIHQDVLDFLQGFEFVSFNIPFIKVDKLEVIKYPAKYFDFGSSTKYLTSIGIKYSSTIRNLLSFLTTMGIFAIIHVALILPIYAFSRKYDSSRRFPKIMKTLYLMFTFNLYLRSILESYQLITMS